MSVIRRMNALTKKEKDDGIGIDITITLTASVSHRRMTILSEFGGEPEIKDYLAIMRFLVVLYYY